jgi:hypothetical protein
MKTQTTPAEKVPGTYAIAQRIAEGEEVFVGALMDIGGITRGEANRVFNYYRKNRLIKRFGLRDIRVTHGSFLDVDVIRRCVELTANDKA